MLVKTIEALRSQGGEVVLNDGQVKVVRFLTKRDGLGVAMSDVRPRAGTETVLWYKHHWEANYIVSGRGTVTNVGTGESWVLSAGTIYTVGPHDQHRLDLDEDTHILSIFNPALVGDEKHDEDGAYAPSGEVLPGARYDVRQDARGVARGGAREGRGRWQRAQHSHSSTGRQRRLHVE